MLWYPQKPQVRNASYFFCNNLDERSFINLLPKTIMHIILQGKQHQRLPSDFILRANQTSPSVCTPAWVYPLPGMLALCPYQVHSSSTSKVKVTSSPENTLLSSFLDTGLHLIHASIRTFINLSYPQAPWGQDPQHITFRISVIQSPTNNET